MTYIEWAIQHSSDAEINFTKSGMEQIWDEREFGLTEDDWQINPRPGNEFIFHEAVAEKEQTQPEFVYHDLGTSGVNFMAMAALLTPNDEVIIEQPAYQPLLQAAELTGADIVRLPRRFSDNWNISVEEFKKLITPKTKLAVVTNLYNPGGVVLPTETVTAMANALAEVGARLLVDEVYLDFIPDRPKSAFHAASNVIVTSSLTKIYGLSTLRAGYLLADVETVERCRKITMIMGAHTPYIAKYLAAKFIRQGQLAAIRKRVLDRVAMNNTLVREFFGRAEELQVVMPEHGIVCFPRFRKPIGSVTFNEDLKAVEKVQVTPGVFFEENQHFRMGFGMETETLRDGLQRLERFLFSY